MGRFRGGADDELVPAESGASGSLAGNRGHATTLAIPADSSLPRLESSASTTCKQSLLKTFPARMA